MSTTAEKFLWTADSYEQAVIKGLLRPDARYELIDGELLTVVRVNPPHAFTVTALDHWFQHALDSNAYIVQVQQPLNLSPESHPEPDLMVVKGPRSRYETRLPEANEVLIAIEVADSSLAYDRDHKIPLYARFGVQEVWLVDLNSRRISVNRSPQSSHYANVLIFEEGSQFTIDSLNSVFNVVDVFVSR